MKILDIQTRIGIKNIVFATDLSPASYDALPFAAELARLYGAKIWGFHVFSRKVYPVPPSLVLPASAEDSREVAEELAGYLKRSLSGVQQEVVIGYGEVWSALSTFIEKNDIDLVVMGTHGRTGLGKAFMGSVAETVFRQCPCPVLTVGPNVSRGTQQPSKMQEILYATDFTPESRKAAPYAISLAQEYQAHLILLHVIEPAKSGGLAHGGELVSTTMRLLRDFISPEAELWCTPEYVVEYGLPAEGILKVAEHRRSHLLVLGVRKPEISLRLTTHFARATACKVIAAATCPTLTVRG